MKENKLTYINTSKGGLFMKRIITAFVLAAALVFAFSAVAQATYRGFTPIRNQAELDDGKLQGFLTFPEAQREMARNFGADGDFGPDDPGASLQNTAHGGYVTTTTKCVVCHSAHRASGINEDAAPGTGAGSTGDATSLANARNQYFLTAGASSCNSCHVNTGGQASRLLVEWGPNGGGPHAAPRRGCTMCHNAGIHGLSSSSFNVMNVFMLGNTRNRNAPGADWPADGQWLGGDPESRDEQITREIGENRVLRGGVLDVPLDSPLTSISNNPSAASTWWYDGDRALGPVGSTPPGVGVIQYSAARSLATAYTCGEAGCHVNTAMFNLNWGMGFERRDQVRDPDTGFGIPQGRTEVTGHVMPSLRVAGGENVSCGPCHAGNPAGFPTASTEAGSRDDSRRAYGCDQCHDMVGVATNSTAWPHGNLNILVYEWDADGTQREVTSAAGNLWMYGGNIARANHEDVPITDANQVGANLVAAGGGAAFRGPTSENISFADQSWMVLTNITAGRYGIPGHDGFTDDPNNPFGNPQVLNTPGTGLTDGSCLKCHVALDSGSRDALDSIGADALRHAWNRAGTHSSSNPDRGDAVNPVWDGTPISGSSRLFLYR